MTMNDNEGTTMNILTRLMTWLRSLTGRKPTDATTQGGGPGPKTPV